MTLASVSKRRLSLSESYGKLHFFMNKRTLEELDKNVAIKYLSCRLDFVRNIFGEFFAREVIGI